MYPTAEGGWAGADESLYVSLISEIKMIQVYKDGIVENHDFFTRQYSVYENVAGGEVYDKTFLNENCPDDKKDDIDYIFSLLDWEKNVDPDYRKHYFRPPIIDNTAPEGCVQKWIVCGNEYVGAKELTVLPGQAVTIQAGAAHGVILTQGHGTIGVHDCETPTLLRFGQLSCDEFFVTDAAARRGVTVTNTSRVEPLVMLKHFGPVCPGKP